MQRRKFVIGMGALASGTAAAVGTGAFTSAQADRTLEVAIATDSDAYLALRSPHHLENTEYAEEAENGELRLDFTQNSAGGEGVNVNSEYYFDDVFNVKNQGTDKIEVWFELSEELEPYVDLYPQGERGNSIVGEENAHNPGHDGHTAVGSSFEVGLEVDVTNAEVEPETVLGGGGAITVHAELEEGRY